METKSIDVADDDLLLDEKRYKSCLLAIQTVLSDGSMLVWITLLIHVSGCILLEIRAGMMCELK
ncbi:hypothetical protein A6E05_00265 [Aliivibrio sp. 1S165]|nr:hypothetical protein A6E05_00265 [Aliivibrio sp. 1S165]OCH19687.1 hypothetical protein A6E03_10180 [Aliivibrio sp. 1S128]OCH30984.1 hypothetical protein A6E06_05240 [Aliivibrio sp. 1S175]